MHSTSRTSALADTGAVALDLDTGATVYSRNATLSLLPASNEKLAVTYAALTALGPGFTIETDVLGDGQQAEATWQGDLVLKGYGDPTLSTADLTALARTGARERDHARHGRHPRRRVVVRLAAHRARLEGGVLHQRVAAALGADRRPRPRRPLHVARSRARGCAALPQRARTRGRPRRRRRRARHRGRRCGADRRRSTRPRSR